MTFSSKGLALAAVHVALVAGTSAKLLYDRAVLPRVWTEAAPFDPNHPFRGRYLQLAVAVDNPDNLQGGPVALRVEGERLTVRRTDRVTSNLLSIGTRTTLSRPVTFFVPQHVPIQAHSEEGEQLCVEVTVPHRGPPRPIRLRPQYSTRKTESMPQVS